MKYALRPNRFFGYTIYSLMGDAHTFPLPIRLWTRACAERITRELNRAYAKGREEAFSFGWKVV